MGAEPPTGDTDSLSVGCRPADAPVGSAPINDGGPERRTVLDHLPYLSTPISGVQPRRPTKTTVKLLHASVLAAPASPPAVGGRPEPGARQREHAARPSRGLGRGLLSPTSAEAGRQSGRRHGAAGCW